MTNEGGLPSERQRELISFEIVGQEFCIESHHARRF